MSPALFISHYVSLLFDIILYLITKLHHIIYYYYHITHLAVASAVIGPLTIALVSFLYHFADLFFCQKFSKVSALACLVYTHVLHACVTRMRTHAYLHAYVHRFYYIKRPHEVLVLFEKACLGFPRPPHTYTHTHLGSPRRSPLQIPAAAAAFWQMR